MNEYRILHAYADHGVEAEALQAYGEVVRMGLDPRDHGRDEVVRADATRAPLRDGSFDLAVLHPPCTRWSDMTSISGDPEDHPDLIDDARELGERVAEHYVVENKPAAPLDDPLLLNGRMFGLPFRYERAFETSFPVEQPAVERSLVEDTVSPYFYADRSREWWAGAKGYTGAYTKTALAKNCVPATYVHYLLRAWLREVNAVDAEPARASHGDRERPVELPDDQSTLLEAQ